MAKKDKAIYAPGELDRVRKNLGVSDISEAKRMSEKLGGEVGYEREPDPDPLKKTSRYGRMAGKGGKKAPRRRFETAEDAADDEKRAALRLEILDPADDPSAPLKYIHGERVRMDKYAGQSEFEIKSSGQVLKSILSFFNEPPDFLNPYFITRRMPEYYQKIEGMVLATRALLPRNNFRRNERLKKTAPLAFAVLDTIRYWNIEKISGDLTRLQSRPRNIKINEFSDIVKAVYKPLFILERMDTEAHIRSSFKILYKVLYAEDPSEAQKKLQPMIRTALSSYAEVRREIRYLIFPLLLKLVSSNWVSYESFFFARKNRLMAFLNVSEDEQLDPAVLAEMANIIKESEPAPAEVNEADGNGKEDGGEKEETLSEEERTKRAAVESEQKAMERGIQALEVLFPRAGWDKLDDYPDLYPYFGEMLDLKKGIVNIPPGDPLQQVYVLMRIIEELFYGLRFVSFSSIHGIDGSSEQIGDNLTEIIHNWHYNMQATFEKDYIPSLVEYVRILEGSPEERQSQYAKKIISDMHWMKRLYFLPYYKFESIIGPSFKKKDATSIFSEIKKLRRYLTSVAGGIEQGNKAGGAASNVHCDGIDNPWAPYTFQVPNPLSKRLDALVPSKKRTNSMLVYFTLAAAVVLDHLVNDENSWAYEPKTIYLFRSVDDKGAQPLTGVDKRIDADKLFMEAVQRRNKQA